MDSIKSTQSNKVCLAVKRQPQVVHWGESSYFIRKVWVTWVWPICILAKTLSPHLMILKPLGDRPFWVWIACNVLLIASSNSVGLYHFKRSLMCFLKSLYVIRIFVTLSNRPALAVTYAFSLPLMPTWLGIQENIILFSRYSIIWWLNPIKG